jgi:endonuclease/exonuclease/phosphatase (EEP) superfamily protein YafD
MLYTYDYVLAMRTQTIFRLLLIVLPAFFLGLFYWATSPWWLENLSSFYRYLGLYFFAIAGLFFVRADYRHTTLCLLIAGFGYFFIFPEERKKKDCARANTLLQYNLFYDNKRLDLFVSRVEEIQSDLLVLQEVSPQHGHQLAALKQTYPFTFGGQPAVGYPSGQMLLSRKPLYGTNVLTTPNGHKIIQTVWRAEEGVDVFVVALHPPSPRNEELWHQRNAVINTALKLAERSPLETTLLVGDFNLASSTRRYRDIARNFQSAPVNTWPVFLKNWDIPVWPIVALDHLLLSVNNNNNRICSREALTGIKGSDHYPVLTTISLE